MTIDNHSNNHNDNNSGSDSNHSSSNNRINGVLLAQVREDRENSQTRYAWFSSGYVSINQVLSTKEQFHHLPREVQHRLRVACEATFKRMNDKAKKQVVNRWRADLSNIGDDLPLTVRARL